MNDKLTHTLSIVLGVLSLLLVLGNIALINSNRTLQDNANQRQADINKASQLQSVDSGLIQALAEAAVNNGDAAIKELLAGQGITINPNAKTTAAAPAPSTKK